MQIPTFLVFYNQNYKNAKKLLIGVKTYLPKVFNAHLSSGLIDTFDKKNIDIYYGSNHKMVLKKKPVHINNTNIIHLKPENIEKINKLYSISYPDNWFDSRMLQTGKYLGYFIKDQLVGIAGIHVYSEQYKVAALGNITTHPNFRGQKISYKLTSQLCYELNKSVEIIGLNVNSKNIQAINCYKNVGFKIIGSYDECKIKIY